MPQKLRREVKVGGWRAECRKEACRFVKRRGRRWGETSASAGAATQSSCTANVWSGPSPKENGVGRRHARAGGSVGPEAEDAGPQRAFGDVSNPGAVGDDFELVLI